MFSSLAAAAAAAQARPRAAALVDTITKRTFILQRQHTQSRSALAALAETCKAPLMLIPVITESVAASAESTIHRAAAAAVLELSLLTLLRAIQWQVSMVPAVVVLVPTTQERARLAD